VLDRKCSVNALGSTVTVQLSADCATADAAVSSTATKTGNDDQEKGVQNMP